LPHPELVFVPGFDASLSNMFGVFLAIALVPGALVLNKAALAPRVPEVQLGIPESELIERFLDAASTTGLDLQRRHRTHIYQR
jgi:hypothetical protein